MSKRICTSFPFKLSNLGGVATVDVGTTKHIEENITHILTTRKGERLMHPEYGTDIDNSIFDIIDTPLYNILIKELIDCLTTYEPRIIVTPEDIYVTNENTTVYLNMRYTIKLDGTSNDYKLQL